MAKKTTTKTTKKTNVRTTKKETVEKTNTVDTMSVDELAEIFKNNDTEKIEQLADEIKPVVETESKENNEPEFPEHVYVAPEEFVEEKKSEPVKEQKKTKSKTEPKQEKKTEETKKENPVQPTKPNKPNTNRAVYGYDHFGMIYGY